MVVVRAAQNGLQNVDSGLDTIQFDCAIKLTNVSLTVCTVALPAASILYSDSAHWVSVKALKLSHAMVGLKASRVFVAEITTRWSPC